MSNVIHARCASCNNVVKGVDQSIVSCPHCFESTPIVARTKPKAPPAQAAPVTSPFVEKLLGIPVSEVPPRTDQVMAPNARTSSENEMTAHLQARYKRPWQFCHVGQVLNGIGAAICFIAAWISIGEAPYLVPSFIGGAIAAIPLHAFFSIGKMVADIASQVCKAD